VDGEFLKIDEKLHELLKNFLNAPLLSRENLDNVPSNGLYAFYENNIPIYVGISGKDRMKTRIMEHGRQSSDNSTAPFAFNIAKKEAMRKNINIQGNRKIIEKNPEFVELFSKAKDRVSRMKVRVIEINDPNVRALFEIYTALVLNTTEFNSFETH